MDYHCRRCTGVLRDQEVDEKELVIDQWSQPAAREPHAALSMSRCGSSVPCANINNYLYYFIFKTHTK